MARAALAAGSCEGLAALSDKGRRPAQPSARFFASAFGVPEISAGSRCCAGPSLLEQVETWKIIAICRGRAAALLLRP